MQTFTALNALAAIGNAPQAASGSGTSTDDAPLDQRFSQLLGDFGAQGGGEGLQQFSRGQLLPSGNGGALAAQGLDLGSSEAVPTDLSQLITPEEATEMLTQVEALLPTSDAPQVAVLEALRNQLQKITQTGTPQTVGHVVAATVPEAPEPPVELVHLVVSLAQLGKKNTKEAHVTEEAPNQVLAAMQNLPAMMFRAAHGEAAAAAPASAQAKKKSRDYIETITVVEPLALKGQVAAVVPEEEISYSNPGGPMPLEEMIPPLKQVDSKAESTTDLPDVSLPVMQSNAAAMMPKNAEPAARGKPDESAVVKALSALDALAPGSDIQYPSHTAALGHPSAAAHATKFVDLIPTAGLVNHAPVKEQVQVAISQAAHDGLDRITIQLDPVDLGRVEINMQTNKDGHTQIFFMVDKPETFDSLSRDARMLERSLQEAGIKADTGSMQFNLRQQPQPQMQSGLNGDGQQQPQQAREDEESQQSAVTGVQSVAAFTRNYLVNIREGVDISA